MGCSEVNCSGALGLDLSLNLAVLPGNCAALEAIQPSQTFLSAVSMLGSKVTEVPFGSISLWFFLLLVPANAALGSRVGFVLGFSTHSD